MVGLPGGAIPGTTWRGAIFLDAIVRRPWGRCEFAVRDPDGHVLRFFAPA